MAVSEVLKLNKKLGETPLECILRFRAEHFEYEQVNMTYLGRLDPMAEGLLLVLAGDTRDKKKYLEFDKSYEFEVLWGFETDTYDVLGLVTGTGPMPQKLDIKMDKLLKDVGEKKLQIYPPYSSRTVGGKALHSWAREGRIEEVEMPAKQIKIFSIEHLNTRLVKQEDVLEEILTKVDLVKGDFRQEDIRAKWKNSIQKGEMCLISHFKADVSSGTYIRSLAQDMGKKLDTSALAYSIKRTRVGEYKL
jgi:tRNA pseudouridine55 synthase